MKLSNHESPRPEAFRGFVEGVQSLQHYLRTNQGDSLLVAERQFDRSLELDPRFAPARYYKAITLTHARKADAAISLFEELRRDVPRFQAEVLYNLAFAYARKYRYELFEKSLALLDEAYQSTHYLVLLGVGVGAKRLDLVLLVKAMRAWVLAVFAGRPYGRSDDFAQRRQKLLPKAVRLAKSVLEDGRLRKLDAETSAAVKVEAHNAAGIAYMRMGQYSKQFKEGTEHYWGLSEQHYRAALDLHSQDVRVLDNISTLNLIRAARAYRSEQEHEASVFVGAAIEFESQAVGLNPNDRFRWLTLARAYAMLGKWGEAEEAADHILLTPGVPSDKQAEELKEAVRNRDLKPILGSYPTEEKSPA